MTPEQQAIIRQLLMKRAGESGDPMGAMKRAGESAPPGAPKNSGQQAAPWDPMTDSFTEQQMADRAKMGYLMDRQAKRADMSGLSPEAREQYLRQSFVAPGQFPDHGANGGPGGGLEMLRQLYMSGNLPPWFQEAIAQGDYNPDALAAITGQVGPPDRKTYLRKSHLRNGRQTR